MKGTLPVHEEFGEHTVHQSRCKGNAYTQQNDATRCTPKRGHSTSVTTLQL